MKKITLADIENFTNTRSMAVAGASRSEKSFSAQAIAHLKKIGYSILSVNPNYDGTDPGKDNFTSIESLPSDISHLLILTSPDHTTQVVKEAVAKGIKNIWMQQKSDNPEAIELCEKNDIHLVTNHCIIMFTQPDGMHRFHYNIKKFFGSLPK